MKKETKNTLAHIVAIMICISVFVAVGYGSWRSGQKRQVLKEARQEACRPYYIVSYFTEQDINFVVCGDGTIRKIKNVTTEE